MWKPITIRLLLLVFLLMIVGLTQAQDIRVVSREEFKSYSYGVEPDFVFRDTITTTKLSNVINVKHPDGDKLNVRFENSGRLANFDIIVNKRETDTKFSYQFRLLSNEFKFNVTIYGDEKGTTGRVIKKSNYDAQLGELQISFNDFDILGLDSKTYRDGNNLIFEFSADWNALGYSIGDLVLLDPIFKYDFSDAAEGVVATRCESGTPTPPSSNSNPLYSGGACTYADANPASQLNSADNSRITVDYNSGNAGTLITLFNITTALDFKLNNITVNLESQINGNNASDYTINIFNHDTTTWDECLNFEYNTEALDETESCGFTTDLTDYFNASGIVSVIVHSTGAAAGSNFMFDFIELLVDSGVGNNTWYESTGLNTEKYLNVTFRYETNNSATEATLDGNYITNPIGISTTNTTSIISTAERHEYEFSYEPPHLNISNDMTLIYANHGTQLRTFQDTLLLTNETQGTNTSLILYLLPQTDGIFVTFQVIDVAERALEGVTIIANRSISGTNTEVQRGTTGSAGTSSFFLNPDIIHTFVFSKTGFNSLTSSFAPTQSLYTITLGSTTAPESNQTNFFQGIKYDIIPIFSSLTNGTSYNFSFNIESDFHPLDVVGFRLFNGTGAFLDNNTCIGVVATGCNVTLGRNIGVNTTIIMNAFWNIDGNFTNVSKSWSVFFIDNRTGTASFTLLRHDFENLFRSFGSGQNAEFTKGILSFLIILFGTGALTFRFGTFSPMAIMIYMFFITAFLDFLGLIPVLVGEFGGINGITVMVGVIALISMIAEVNIRS